jgi:predicted RNA-binding protein with TRAM domain
MAYSAYNKRRFEGEKPVKEGQEYDITIEGIGSKGDGIGKVKGFVVIVPNTKEGDTVKVKVTAVRGKIAFGEVVGEAGAAPEGAAEEHSQPEEMPAAPSEGEGEAEASGQAGEQKQE